jgi:nucleotide-binding universal stress UspA family protein
MKVLIATDASQFSNAAIDKCIEVLNTDGLAVRVISVVEPPLTTAEPFVGSVDFYRETEEAIRQQAESAIKMAKDRLSGSTSKALLESSISSEVLIGSPARRIVEEAQKWEADLIVIGSHGYGFWERMLIGSVSQSVVQHAPCSVLVVRKDTAEEV